MAQQVKSLANKPDNLSLILQDPHGRRKLFCELHMCSMAYMHVCTHRETERRRKRGRKGEEINEII